MINEDNHINELSSKPIKLKVNTAKGIYYITVEEILYIKAENKYTTVYFINSGSIETHHLLKWYCEHLHEKEFCKCHRSIIINCDYVEGICGNEIILKENIRVSLSRYKKSYIINHFLNNK
ncbi:MAG: LytTR family DNA-binding domain-containing protein [Bacteroidia bacterium]|nr:LytTR family DNA-binding domain-containing protein [Bacteroidia bacterium]